MPGMLYYSKGKLLALITAKMAVCPISRYFHLEQPLLLPWRWFYPIAGKGLSCLCLGLIYILFRESSQGYGHVFASTVVSHKPHRTLGTLLSVCGSLDGRGVSGRMDTCICTAESLCCSPKTITTLLISYTPIQTKKFKNKSIKKYKINSSNLWLFRQFIPDHSMDKRLHFSHAANSLL